jgi:hypothetical protein
MRRAHAVAATTKQPHLLPFGTINKYVKPSMRLMWVIILKALDSEILWDMIYQQEKRKYS